MRTTYRRPKTIQTILHTYSIPRENRAEYKAELAKIEANGKRQCFCVLSDLTHRPEPGTVTLETAHVFNNQWNADRGRLFDWFEAYRIESNGSFGHHIGHWLELTPEMIELRERVHVCGYCGTNYDNPPGLYCKNCITSEYLTPKDFPLLQLLPVSRAHKKRQLPPEALAEIEALYVPAQIAGNAEREKKRAERERLNASIKYEETLARAETEYRGRLWLLDHGISTALAIFYDHLGKWSFGWLHPLAPAVADELQKKLADFPYSYTIERADRATL